MSEPFLNGKPYERADALQHSPADEASRPVMEVDLQALAKEVYAQLKEDLRHEAERQGRP
jgi:hypothetical protein